MQIIQQSFSLQNLDLNCLMSKYLIQNPQNSHTFHKQHPTNQVTINPQDCPYCQMKRKFNIGSQSETKCLQHSMKIHIDDSSIEDNLDRDDFMNAEEMIEALGEVEASLDYYWDNLREISGGSPYMIHKELEPVLSQVKRVQQKIGKFFYDNTFQFSEIKPISTQSSLHKRRCTGSEKFFRAELSNLFDLEENNVTQSIKEWVMHFYKILQLRQQPENLELLPCEEDLQMRVFKQSMERKFVVFADEITKYEKKVKDVLTKLIFYMEKSSATVPEKQIEQDILFIENHHMPGESPQSQLQKILLLQASSIEFMLVGLS